MLLMTDPSAAREGPEATLEIPHGTARVVPARQGQLLTVVDVEGGRSAQLYAFVDGDPREFLSPHHTRVFSNSYVLAPGMRLVTNRRRPLMVLGRDDVRAHDLLTPAATARTLDRAGRGKEADAREIALDALAEVGLDVPKLPDPVNLFLNVGLHQDGTLVPAPSRAGPGSGVTCRVLIDAHLVVAAGAVDLDVPYATGPLAVRVHNNL